MFNSYLYNNNSSSGARYGKSMDTKRILETQKFGPSKSYINESEDSSSKICGIINLGNNCYLNSGLQILASCDELVYELYNTDSNQRIIPYIKDAINSLLTEKIYNPNKFIDYFCSQNSDFIRGSQCCSQNFIRTLIRNMNLDCLNQNDTVKKNSQYNPSGTEKLEYEKFLYTNKIYPESKIQSIFSGITKSCSQGICKYCKTRIDNYSFNYFIDLNLYLDEIYSDCSFSHVLNSNIGGANNLSMNCPGCKKEITLKEYTTFIKLPDILIFTLERYQGETNNVKIKPDSPINFKQYIDKNLYVDCTNYELFAINIRYGKTANFGHEICQVKRDGVWYEINDRNGNKIKNTSHYDCSYGLFYRKTNHKSLKDYPLFNTISFKKTKEKNDYFKTEILKFDQKKESNDKNQKYLKALDSGIKIISLFYEFKNELKEYESKGKSQIKLIKDAINMISDNKEADLNKIVDDVKSKYKVEESS